MKRDDAKKLLPIIGAYGNGEDIEWFDGHIWQDGIFIGFSDKPENYRIKSKPKLVPFTFEDNKEFRDKWIYDTTQKSPGIMRITSYNNSNIHTEFKAIEYQSLFEDYLFEDGSPCGKYINE